MTSGCGCLTTRRLKVARNIVSKLLDVFELPEETMVSVLRSQRIQSPVLLVLIEFWKCQEAKLSLFSLSVGDS